ncbi:MAG: hypothetical protein ACRDY1_09155, partial [Acidimicrobiales bacterium]
VGHHAERLETWRRLLSAYDVERQLERGYTLTVGEDGAVVRSAAGLGPGTVLRTRFADGTAVSDVRDVEMSVLESDGERPARRREQA